MKKTIEVQYFEGCPHAPAALELAKRFQQEHLEVTVKITQVRDNEQAAELGFRGSPTILIDGQDLFDNPIPENPHLACRFYPNGLPDYENFSKMINK